MMMNRSHTTSYPRMSPIRRRKDRHLFHRDDRDVANNNEDATIVQELHYNSNNNNTIVESTFNFDDFDTISSCNEKGEEEGDTDNLLLMNDDEDDDNSSNLMYSTMLDYGEYYDDDDVDHDAITADTTTTSVGMANPKRCTASSSSNTSNKRRKVTLNKTNKYNKSSVAITPETTLKVVTDISFASIPPVATVNADVLTKNTTQTGRKLPYTSSLFLDDSYNIGNGHGDENDPRVAGSNKTEENMVNLNYKPSVVVFDNKIYECQYEGGSGEDTTTFEEEITRRPPPLSPIFGLPSIKEINNDDDDDDDNDDTGDLLDNHLQVTTASYDEDKDDQHREYDILRNGDVYRILQSLVPLHESFTVLVLLLLHMEALASLSSSIDDGNTNCNGNTAVVTKSVVQEACTIAYAMLVDAKGFRSNNNNSRKKKKQKSECCDKKLLGDIVDTLIDKFGPDVNFYCLFQHVERQQQQHTTATACNNEGSITGNSTMNSILRLYFQQDDGLLEVNKVVGNVATNSNDDSTSTQTTANVVAGVISTRNDAINTTMASVAGAASHQSVVGVPTPPIATTTSSTLLPLAVAYGAMYYDHRRDTDVENEDNNNKNLLLEDFVMDTCEKLQWMTEYQQHNLWKTIMD